jgi:hypothetical protein
MNGLKVVLAGAVGAALLLLPAATTIAKPAGVKRVPHIIVYPNYRHKTYGKYGFLPGYRQPPALSDWRERSPLYGGPRRRSELRFWEDGAWRYGWGGPGYYRGTWNGGSFGPCWTQTPIGPMWNCGN